MSSMWPEPPEPGRGYPQQRWVRRSRWPAVLGVLGLLLLVGLCACSFWVRPVLP